MLRTIKDADRLWERRIRYALSKYGLRLHKSRKRDGGYTVVDDDGEEGAWFSCLLKLQEFCFYLYERYECS